MNKIVLALALLAPVIYTEGVLNLDTLRHCCGLGTEHAKTGAQCDSVQPPFAGVSPSDERTCLHSARVCCKNQNEELQCGSGINAAKNGGACDAEIGAKKDCCEACHLGIETGNTHQGTCQDVLGLGAPFDKAFVDCCKEALTISTTTTSTTTPTPPISQQIKSTSKNDLYSPLPPIGDICDIGDVCAHICIPTGDSYKCECNQGFTLMGDGISCKPDKRASKKADRCSVNNPCQHTCIDTGVAVKCSCQDGYELSSDKRSCKDIDECALKIDDCKGNEICVNDDGAYFCDDPDFQPETDLGVEDDTDLESKCPTGYKFNYEKLACDDIDECQFEIICPRPKTCSNTLGSFICEGDDRPQCPPGFYFKPSIDTCADVDECVSGDNDCNKESQTCLNTKGNYTCIDNVSKRTCPPGFKKNPVTNGCDDINECEESEELCAQNETCVNEVGGHTCEPRQHGDNFPFPMKPPQEPSLPPKPAVTSTTTTTTTTTTTPKSVTCPRGYQLVGTQNCIDINECEDKDACDSNQECYNAPGSYVCNCKPGFKKDYQTGACIDVNECQIGTHDCTVAQRCDNTIGSYLCARMTGCGTGYTLNYASGLCEDDDECALGQHSCNELGPNYKCRNTLGSYRCDPIRSIPNSPALPVFEPARSTPQVVQSPPPYVPQTPPQTFPHTKYTSPPYLYTSPPIAQTRPTPPPQPPSTTPKMISGTLKRCLPGYVMSQYGRCEDINECESNPCPRGKECFNLNGRFQCVSTLQCRIGLEIDESGEKCVDINECARGTHKCSPSQICKNGVGFYTCECPPGHHINPFTKLCEDIDECKYYRVCSINADCMNTIGSYKCRCREGFQSRGNLCEDINECTETARLCEHNCVNVWGTYKCGCKAGFTLNSDNRTCTDIDECERFKDKRLCIGICENVPGSYTCKCPKGYQLGNDARTCIDIDECRHNICPSSDDVCLNTHGSYKCFAITCPDNYFRDPQHKGRCKRPTAMCDSRDFQCIQMPEQYTYHYITLVSDLQIQNESVQFFQMNGPKWAITKAEFSMDIVNVIAPFGVEKVHERFFKVVKSSHNTLQLYLVRSITGPQEVELKVEMRLFHGNIMTAKVVAYIFIVVSEYIF